MWCGSSGQSRSCGVRWSRGGSRTPLVVHLHHSPNYGRSITLLYKGATRFIAVSEFMARTWIKGGVRRDRVLVLTNAVRSEVYPRGGLQHREQARRSLDLPSGVPIALYYGRLEESKGVGVLLDAWDQLAAPPDWMRLVLAGDLPQSPDSPLRGRFLSLAQLDTVSLLPNQGGAWVSLLHEADIVIFPSFAR